MPSKSTVTNTQKSYLRKGNVFTVTTTVTTTVTEPGKEPEVTKTEDVQTYEGEDNVPEDVRKEFNTKMEVKNVNFKACDDDFEKDLLEEINKYRDAHGVPSLKHCKELTKYAKKRAEEMAEKDELSHGSSDFGENIGGLRSTDPNSKIVAEDIAKEWYNQGKDYDFTKEPEASQFTQMIWKGSEKFGAAAAKSKTNGIFFVAAFSPSGNWKTQFVANVLPKKKSLVTKIKEMILPSDDSSDSDDDDDIDHFNKKAVKIHNSYRKIHGVPKLKYNANLAKCAQAWADNLASSNQFKHRANNKYGENLYTYNSSTGTQPTPKMACEAWYNEIGQYTFGSKNGSSTTGHFSQMVWKNTTSVGLGISKAGKGWIVVAKYDPPGNCAGVYAENVLPPVKN